MRSVKPTCLALALVITGCHGDAPLQSDSVDPSGNAIALTVGSAQIELQLPDEPMDLSRDEIAHWIAVAARAVTTYYGRFPVEHAIIEVMRTEGRGIDGGRTFRNEDGAVIRIGLGARADAADLARDWVMTHEMVHTALPDLPRPQHWLEEGLATYVESIARAQAGLESDAEVWRQLVRGLPQGLPQPDDQGLDLTPTWGRT